MADGTIIEIKPFFQGRLNALGFGTELERAFDLENVPRNQIDKAFHILIGPITGISQNQTDQQMSVDTTLSVFFKGFRDEETATVESYEQGELIISDVCSPTTRTAIPCLKNIEFISMIAEPFDDSNDNIIRLLINFEVLLILDLDTP